MGERVSNSMSKSMILHSCSLLLAAILGLDGIMQFEQHVKQDQLSSDMYETLR